MIGQIQKYRAENQSGTDTAQDWEDFLRSVYYAHDVKTIDGRPISGVIEKGFVADIGISRHCASAHTILRTPQLIKLDKVEQHAFVLPTAGRFDCTQGGRAISVAAGSIYILNASEPFSVTTTDGAASVALILPSKVCRHVLTKIDDKCCVADVGDPILIDCVVTLLSGLMDRDTNIDDVWLRDVILDLLDAAISPKYSSKAQRGWKISDAARIFILDAARREIDRRLREQSFSVADAASACEVSVRHLQNVFQGIGSTFGEELLEARLIRAAELLRSPSHRVKRIATIAEECGFRNKSHFSTRFRARFGHKPTDERS